MTTVQKDVLSRAIGIAVKAVGANPIIPLLSNVLFESNNGKSRVAATNLEIGIGCTFPSQGEEFRTCVPAKVFASLIDALSSPEVELQQNAEDQSIRIITETSKSKIHCAPADEFPDIPKVTAANFSLPVAQFKEMVQRVAFCSAVNTSSVLEGVQLSVESKSLIMFAVDGYHISFEKTPLFKQGKGKISPFVVKGTALETISRILPDEGILEVQVAESKAMFHCKEVDVVTQLLSGEFPDHNKLREAITEPKTTLTISTMELLRTSKQLRVFATETGNSKLEVQGMLTRYSIVAQDKGDSDVTFMAIKKGKDVTIGLSVHMLYEFLEVCKTQQVIVEIIDHRSPILFRMQGLDDFYHVIMPINL